MVLLQKKDYYTLVPNFKFEKKNGKNPVFRKNVSKKFIISYINR